MLELSNQILKMVHLLLICQEQELIPDANWMITTCWWEYPQSGEVS